jgi:hypothetical protein
LSLSTPFGKGIRFAMFLKPPFFPEFAEED